MATSFAERLDREREAAFAAASRGDRTRKAALHSLAEIGLPTNRDENWKYANLRALERVRLVSAGEPGQATLSVLPARIAGFSRQVFVDGLHSAQLSDPSPAKPALVFEPLRSSGEAAPETVQRSRAHAADLRFALLNTAFAVDGARISVRGHGDEPVRIELNFVATVDGSIAASYPRIELVLEAGARLQLIERHASEGDAASFVNSAAEIVVGEGAQLSHFRIQQMGVRALWVDTLNAEVARDGRYELHALGLGASSARSTCFVRLDGEGAQACVYAAAVADEHQTLDGFVRVEHVGTRTTTNEIFRGIAAGRSRVAFNGAVIVQSGARGADSKQSLRGLLAGPGAEIDARPQLEIYTDEVRCSHGATAGTLDENMLFYLLSRGIDRETARSLLEWVFLEDVIGKIGVPDLRRQLEAAVAGRLRHVNLQELR